MNKLSRFLLGLLVAGVVQADEQAAVSISGSLTGSNGRARVVANTTDNEFLVGWVNRSQKKAYVRVVAASGTPLGQPTVISTKSAGEVTSLAYASSTNDYLVVWQTATSGKTANTLYAQRVGADGQPVGTPIKVAADSKKLNWQPSVVYNPDDDVYLIVWSKEGLRTSDGGSWSATADGLYGRFVNPDGTFKTDAILIKAMSYEQDGGTLHRMNYQGYVVGWQATKKRYGILTNHVVDAEGTMQIEFMTADRNGALVAGPKKVNRSNLDNGSVETGLAVNSTSGAWLALWEDYLEQKGSDAADLNHRMVSVLGNPTGNENKTFDTGQACGDPVAAFDRDKGNFLVAFWADDLDGGTNVNVRGQFVTGTGALSGQSFGIATTGDAEAEQWVAYNTTAKKYFVVYAQATSQGQLNLMGTIVQPK